MKAEKFVKNLKRRFAKFQRMVFEGQIEEPTTESIIDEIEALTEQIDRRIERHRGRPFGPSSLIKERNKDFLNECRRLVRKNPLNLNLRDVARQAARNEAPRFYVEYDRARLMIGRIRRGDRLCEMSMENRCKWLTIARLTDQIEVDKRMATSDALYYVLKHCKAPSYFLSPRGAERILYDN